jgi:transcriptional regulator with XRE-family HTH domain
MPRSPEIERFAEKLGVVLDRLSLSRVQLAQLAGVDKSVARRWASGRTRPGEQSIVRLTDIVRRGSQIFRAANGTCRRPSSRRGSVYRDDRPA